MLRRLSVVLYTAEGFYRGEKMVLSKSGLAILLSRLKVFEDASRMAEQYPTDSEIAAGVLWQAYMLGDIAGKRIADLGCGTGILAIGAALLGAKSVIGIDTDEAALARAGENLSQLCDGLGSRLPVRFVEQDVRKFSQDVDTVIQNPPFGTAEKHADRVFLEKACSVASVVWSFHKESTARFVESFAADAGFAVTHILPFGFPLKRSMAHHRKRIERIRVCCWRLCRKVA